MRKSLDSFIARSAMYTTQKQISRPLGD